jgi:hypothetical protein
MDSSPANNRFAWFLYGIAAMGAAWALHSNFRTSSERDRIAELERELASHYAAVLTAPMSAEAGRAGDRCHEDLERACLLLNVLKDGIGHQLPECAPTLDEAAIRTLGGLRDRPSDKNLTPE